MSTTLLQSDLPGLPLRHRGKGRDVLRLIDMIRSRVQECFHVDLELDISIW